MPTPTYVAIAKTVLTGTQATVTFSSIPSTYTDLYLVISARSSVSGTNDSIYLTLNSTSSNYSDIYLQSNGSSVTSGLSSSASSVTIGIITGATATANSFGSLDLYIPSYTGAQNKPFSNTGVSETNSASANQAWIFLDAGLWRNTAAINTIGLQCISGSFVSGSRFDLYGIKNS